MKIEFELDKKKFDELMNKTGLATRSGVINEALNLFQWAIQQSENGLTIGASDGGEIVCGINMRPLRFASRQAKLNAKNKDANNERDNKKMD